MMLRSIFEGVRDVEGNWRRRRSEEIRDICGQPIITQTKVRWLRRVVRMTPKRAPNKVLEGGKEKKKAENRKINELMPYRWYR